ncbi:suppressor of cytokine signaling 3-like [Rhineura floridana]|uniref:suppressor of cytokine signaling 3-like n=1 Tax=Rhineura floridana TaxID=261503 RepID=UPI002AC88936|nr:suppressor of cytokine signaling 3-like [Rhineura floridana]XP_061446269.1 suppressor of cytokine signaling 3-like [Rhineura floridana]XP_061446270.1 suppressor of cytokine signaling 3-like [Rhineura floridana]XP_061446271.1 suppressor of cytokine signaling 3-like [Rhineura floridana]XP_061446272.1 suppressor of cytokine signaling 3-like [Rhineura floridana]XP_061446273.1 suppressor of cytokine signaling 3-like [Rhineura floridana]
MVPLCWCCPPAPAPAAVAMTSTATPSYHFKSFCGEFEQVESALERLEASGFYWGSLSGTEAKQLLTSQPPGVFLVRDSSDHHHLFTLSIRTNTGITNLRIQQQGSAFHLEALPGAGHAPAFHCVVQLVEHYLCLGTVERGPCYLEREGQPPVPLALLHPLCCKVPTLQELCRRAVRASMRGRGDTRAQLQALPVPQGLLNSLCS